MPLTRAQREELERRLNEERTRVRRDLDRLTGDLAEGDEQERSADLTKMPFHMADRGSDTMETELAASNVTRESRELGEIEDALERLHRAPDRFGLCEDTGREIPFERLSVIPWARTCEQAGM